MIERFEEITRLRTILAPSASLRPLIVVLASLLVAAIATAARPQDAESYLELVRGYREGRYRASVTALVPLSNDRVERSAREIRQRYDEARRRSELVGIARSGALLHTEAAFASQPNEGFHLAQAKEYLKLLEIRSGSAAFERDWHLLVAFLYLSQLQPGRAEPYLESAFELDRDAVAPRLARGVAAALRGWLGADDSELSRARSVFEELSREPGVEIEARVRLAHVRLLRGDDERAREILEHDLPRIEDLELLTVSHALLGKAHAETRDFARAVEHYEAALALDADYQNAVVGLGDALWKSGRRERARRVLAEFLTGPRSEALDSGWRFVLGDAARVDLALARMRQEASR